MIEKTFSTSPESIVTYFEVLALAVKDPIAQISQKGFEKFHVLVKKNAKVSRNDISSSLDTIINCLFDKLPTANEKLRSLLESIFLDLGKCSSFGGVGYCVGMIGKQKKNAHYKSVKARLDLLGKFLKTYHGNNEINLNVVGDIVVRGLENSNQFVRRKAVVMVGEIRKIYGDGKVKEVIESRKMGAFEELLKLEEEAKEKKVEKKMKK